MVQMEKGKRLMGGARPPSGNRREAMISTMPRQPERQTNRGGGAYPVPIPVRPRPQMPQMPGGGMMRPSGQMPPMLQPPNMGAAMPPPGMGQGGMQPGFQTGMMPPHPPAQPMQPPMGQVQPGFQAGMMPPQQAQPMQQPPGGNDIMAMLMALAQGRGRRGF